MVTEDEIEDFTVKGYFIINSAFPLSDIQEIRQRLEDIISGEFSKQGRRFQPEGSSGNYEDVSHFDIKYRGPDISYRKVADLEYDDVFLYNLQHQWLHDLCNQFVGSATSIMRVTMMDKPRILEPLCHGIRISH